MVKVASCCSTVLKATGSVVDLSSGLFSITDLVPSSGVVLYSTFGVSGWEGFSGFGRIFGSGCVGCSVFVIILCWGCVKVPKSPFVKYPT